MRWVLVTSATGHCSMVPSFGMCASSPIDQQASAHWRYALGELRAFSWRPFRNPPPAAM